MPQTRHVERHFTAGETVRDIVIGMSDGLTVPFALAAGLTGAINSAGIIVTAGFGGVVAGAVRFGFWGVFSGPRGGVKNTTKKGPAENRKSAGCPNKKK